MRRSGLSVLAALVLVPLLGGGVVLAAPPAKPQVTGVTATWAMLPLPEDPDAGTWCSLTVDATLDPAYTKGQPVYVSVHTHWKWVPTGGTGTFSWDDGFNTKLAPGATSYSLTGFYDAGGQGYYVVNGVRVEVETRTGHVVSSMEIETLNTCEGPPS